MNFVCMLKWQWYYLLASHNFPELCGKQVEILGRKSKDGSRKKVDSHCLKPWYLSLKAWYPWVMTTILARLYQRATKLDVRWCFLSIHTASQTLCVFKTDIPNEPVCGTEAVFTWARITFRKTFRIAIQNVIGIVIWITCVHMHCKRLPNHDQDLRTARSYFVPTTQSALIDTCMASARISKLHTFRKSFAFTCPRIRLSRRITIQNAPFFVFQNAFQKPDLKQLCVRMG